MGEYINPNANEPAKNNTERRIGTNRSTLEQM